MNGALGCRFPSDGPEGLHPSLGSHGRSDAAVYHRCLGRSQIGAVLNVLVFQQRLALQGEIFPPEEPLCYCAVHFPPDCSCWRCCGLIFPLAAASFASLH